MHNVCTAAQTSEAKFEWLMGVLDAAIFRASGASLAFQPRLLHVLDTCFGSSSKVKLLTRDPSKLHCFMIANGVATKIVLLRLGSQVLATSHHARSNAFCYRPCWEG